MRVGVARRGRSRSTRADQARFASIGRVLLSRRFAGSTSVTAAVVGVVAALSCACAASPEQRAARRGDWSALHGAIGARERAGNVSNGEAASLAASVADRELRAASGPDAIELVGDARPCARELDEALAFRMKTRDDAGARAALARIDSGRLDAGDARAFVGDADGSWRAVGARALVRRQDRDARLRALVDAEPLVRREAVRACRSAGDAADLDALFEAGRLDPDAFVRTEAVRAIAAIAAPPAARASDRLRDLWTSGDEPLREDIALAWGGAALWEAGGRETLRVVVASEHGPAAVEAASALLRRSDPGSDAAREAASRLAALIDGAPRRTRLQALAEAPATPPEVLGAVQRAAADDDLDVRVAALARLAATGDARRQAVTDLEGLARPESAVAARARFALATLGDRRVQAWIEQDLASAVPELRLEAAGDLAALGVAGRAAVLLADPQARVRVRAACTILMSARRM